MNFLKKMYECVLKKNLKNCLIIDDQIITLVCRELNKDFHIETKIFF